jgi:hypothetical protein
VRAASRIRSDASSFDTERAIATAPTNSASIAVAMRGAYRAELEANFFGPLLSQVFAPIFKANVGKVIVNVL